MLLLLVACKSAPVTTPSTTVIDGADYGVGSIEIPTSFAHQRGGTDSAMGTLTSPDGTFVIHYDIGYMAGLHMHEGRKAECSWWSVEVKDRRRVTACVLKDGPLVVSATSNDGDHHGHPPANFTAVVRTDEEREQVLRIARSYSP